jgi:anti-sigma factor RsiW
LTNAASGRSGVAEGGTLVAVASGAAAGAVASGAIVSGAVVDALGGTDVALDGDDGIGVTAQAADTNTTESPATTETHLDNIHASSAS